MSPHAFLFDFDGTLIDSNEAHIDAWRHAFLSHGHNISRERIRPEIGKGGDQLVPSILGHPAELHEGEELRKAHDEAFAKLARERALVAFPGALALLETLRRRWFRVALVSSTKKSVLELTQKSAGVDLLSRFDEIIGGDAAERSKPDPELLHVALRRLALPPHDCLFVGDTVHDAGAASRAGIPFVGLLCGRCATESDLALAGAVSVWRDPQDLHDHLEQAIATMESLAVK